MNIVAAQVSAIIGDSAEIILDHGTTLHLPLRGAQVKAGDTVSLGIRPEHLSVSTAGILKAPVKLAERLGSETLLHLTGPNNVAIVVRADGLAAQKPGDIVALSLPAACCHLFDEKGHALVNGALFGFFTYATYDLTNQATLKDWTTQLTVIDMAWGTVLGAFAASLAYLVASRLAGA